MYSYTWDSETGGLLLNTSPLSFSKEPRPVYYRELDILGFDKYWNYEKSDAAPYLWAEANNYFYRGKQVAKTKGGSLYTAPELIILDEPEPHGGLLQFVDIAAMVKKNQDFVEKLAQETMKKIYNTYVEYRDKVDVFYVAFSGGKDSVVVLDLVQRALPHNKFRVLFGDTGMEFPDTYEAVKKSEKDCRERSIDFIRAKSHLSPMYTWSKFGPPATVTRWCCSVHKTVPQILALREATGKINFTGLAFIGIRASESLSRSEYDYISLGEKHRGQYSCNPILEWNSAELFLYVYCERLSINETYKKGNRRAGCLVCPRATERNDYMSRAWYTAEFDSLVEKIKISYRENFTSEQALDQFIANGGWKARKNGRDISITLNYTESVVGDYVVIIVESPRTDWHEWIKTVGIVQNESSPYQIFFHGAIEEFEVFELNDKLEVRFHKGILRSNPLFAKLLKNVFRKAACCIMCKECSADCHEGCLQMDNGKISISENCLHCAQCHKVEKGCLVYKSLEMPKGGLRMSATKSLNCYSHHAPKMDWFKQFFAYKNEFDQRHTLGSQMYSFFKRFLRDAELLNDNGFSDFADVFTKLGLDNLQSWALMLVNLAYSPQINWLIKRVPFNEVFQKDYTISLLVADGAKESWVADVWSSFSRILDLPFNKIGLGTPERNKNKLNSINRTPWQNPDSLVVLYSLYKFAEACGGYYQFTLSRLLDHEIDSDGVSPTEIFGIGREPMEKILNGLSINHPEFINVSFTLDLESITLNEQKTSSDVLRLF